MICLHFEKNVINMGIKLKGLGLGSKNLLFIFRFPCLFKFRKHQQFIYIFKKAKSSSIWVSNERSGDLAWDRSGGDRSGRVGLGGEWSDRDRFGWDGSVRDW
jgi:hypothetical protein